MRLPTGTVTFLMTDIEGSTQLWDQHPDPMRQALAHHDALVATIIDRHEGTLVKSRGEGDSLFAVFTRATDALAAACQLQQALLSETWPPDTSLRVRMALHTGEVDLREGDYYGGAVNRCARLRAIGHGGQVLLSDVTQELVWEALPEGASLQDLGSHRLRDLSRPEQVFQLLHPTLPSEFPALRSLDALPNNLPQQLTSFIGREQEMEEVRRLLGKTRLLTLTGSGGCGKTRLALQVAAELLEKYPEGVWLVELAPLSDPVLVPQTVASVLGVREAMGEPLVQTLIDSLKSKRLLLVLDNCEHLLSACAHLADALLRACPQVKLLATSREGMNIGGETTYRVPSLSLPDPKQAATVETLSQYEAVRLFIERAEAVVPSFAITKGSAPALAGVCHHLDGIPLAIELAAARVRSLSVEEIHARLDDRFRLLTGGSRTALPRQQTLRAAIDWSYTLLSEEERMLLQRLSVFVGGWTLEAAEAVCDGRDEGPGMRDENMPVSSLIPHPSSLDVLDLLTGLVDKSLVVYEEHRGEAGGRYRLLETVRQYAREKLTLSKEAEGVRRRHRDYYVAWAERLHPPRSAMPNPFHMTVEHENLRAALDLCRETEDGAEPGLRLVNCAVSFWFDCGYLQEGQQRFAEALAHPRTTPTAAWWDARLYEAGWFFPSSPASRSVLEECLAHYREAQDRAGEELALEALGIHHWAEGDRVAARPCFEEALGLLRASSDSSRIPTLLYFLGEIAFKEKDYEAALHLYEEAHALDLARGQQVGGARVAMGRAAFELGDHDRSKAVYRECVKVYAAANIWYLIEALTGLARLAAAQKQWERAACLLGVADSQEMAFRNSPLNLDDALLKPLVETLTAELGQDGFDSAFAVGRAMTLEHAIDYALEEGDSAAP